MFVWQKLRWVYQDDHKSKCQSKKVFVKKAEEEIWEGSRKGWKEESQAWNLVVLKTGHTRSKNTLSCPVLVMLL